jgi:hypothetical protein
MVGKVKFEARIRELVHKLPADYPIFRGQPGKHLLTSRLTGFDR